MSHIQVKSKTLLHLFSKKKKKKFKKNGTKTRGVPGGLPAKHLTKTLKKVLSIQPGKLCIYCGGSYPHSGSCPAQGQTCSYCGKPNHFQRACIKRKKDKAIHNIQEHEDTAQNTSAQQSDSSEDEYTYVVHAKHTLYTLPTAPVKVNNHECPTFA